MKKFILIILLSLLCSTVATWAEPAHPQPFQLTLYDGTVVTARAVGDESFHYFVTLDGTPVVKTSRGYELMPGKANELKTKYRQLATKRNAPLVADMMQKVKARRLNAGTNGIHKALSRPDATKFRGKKDVLVLLVEFPNCKFQNTAYKMYRMFNEVGYNDNGNAGSVHDYFYDNSCGQFDLHFDVEGPIMMDHNYEYYGGNDEQGTDTCAYLMVQEACGKAGIHDWLKYDNDCDGEVDQVCVVYAGFPESSHSKTHPEYIWPHRKEMLPWYPDGKHTIRQYCMTSEMLNEGWIWDDMAGIGTFCHEFSHCLGLPDFYDVDYDDNETGLGPGMGSWDIMANGSNNGPDEFGQCPVGYTAFERWYFGWMDFDVLDKSAKVSLPPISKEGDPHALAIYQDERKDEMIVLENRQKSKWYKYTGPSSGLHGMLAYRVCVSDEAVKNLWEPGGVNGFDWYQCMVVIPANNTYGEKNGKTYDMDRNTCNKQLFPNGSLYLDSLSHKSSNGCWLENNLKGDKNFHFSLEGIDEVGTSITFTYINHDEEGKRFDNDHEGIETGGSGNGGGSGDGGGSGQGNDGGSGNGGGNSGTGGGSGQGSDGGSGEGGIGIGDVITKPAKLTQVRYWVDNAKQATVLSPRKYFTMDANNLDYGMHTLYVQLFDANNCGSDVYVRPFYKLPDTDGRYYEYWFDFDKQVTTISPSSTAFVLDAKHLNEGFHTLYLRQRNNTYCTDVKVTMFYRNPPSGMPLKMVTLVDGQFLSQEDVPRDGSATTVKLHVDKLSTGFHLAQFIVLNAEGCQTDVYESFFYKMPTMDKDRSFNLVYTIDYGVEKVASISANDEERTFLLNATELQSGMHFIRYRLMDDEGYVYEENECRFEVLEEDIDTAVDEVSDPDQVDNLNAYDLLGRRVSKGSKGIRIVGGKKIIFK